MGRFLIGGVASAPIWLVGLLLAWRLLGKPYDDFRYLKVVPWLMLLTGFACYRRKWLVSYVAASAVIAFLTAILVPGFFEALAQRQMHQCRLNLKQLSEALQRAYAQDQHYPVGLGQLTPAYLKSLPTCPAHRGYDYVMGYTRTRDGLSYTVRCSGHADRWVPDYPAFSSQTGLIEAPYLDRKVTR